ncbi:hypothetical protein Tco_1213627 [Tanacetum coccineum]
MGSNKEIVQLLQKTQTIFKQTQRDKEKKHLNDIIQLQEKIKDLENVVCKMGRSTDTLRLLTNEQKAFRDNLHKSGVGYNGSCVLSQAYAKIPKLYRASEICDKNEQLHVFDSEKTLEDAEKSQLKMNEFQKDEKRSAEQTYFSSSYKSSVSKTSSEKFASKTKPSMASMPSANPMLATLIQMDKYYRNLFGLLEKNRKRESIFYTSKEEQRLIDVCIEGKNILREWQTYFEAFQNLFQRTYKDLFESVQRSKVETHQCDEAKVKDDFDEIETRNIELEYRVASLIKENEHLKFKNILEKIEFFKKKQLDISELNMESGENVCDNAKLKFDSLNRQKWNINVSKSSKPKESVSEKVHTGESSKLFSRRVSQFTLHDEIERISKELKDVSNESKTVDTACNDAFEVKQELSKRIVELEKDLSKSEAKSIAVEIALQHKSRENNCWELYFELIMTKHIKGGGPTRQSWNNINAD